MIKDINSETPDLRDDALSMTLGKYSQYDEPLIDPIGVVRDITVNNYLKKSKSLDGLLTYTNKNEKVIAGYESYRDLNSENIVEYDKIVDLYSKDDTYLDLVEKNWFGVATNAVSSILSGGGIGIGMDSTGKLDVSTTFVNDTLVTRALDIASGNETKLGKLATEYLGIALANSVIAKGTTAFDKWVKEPLGFMDAVDKMDSDKLGMSASTAGIIGSIFPIYLYSDIKKGTMPLNDGNNIYSWKNVGGSEVYVTNGGTTTSMDISDVFVKQSLLYKTQKLFESGKIKTMIDATGTIEENGGVDVNGTKIMSRGRALLKSDKSDFCRVWTVNNQYRHISNLIRPFSNENKSILDKNLERVRPGQKSLDTYSVLEKNGMVKITPYQNKGKFTKSDTKQYMFSIENLAWKGHLDNIIKGSSQEGPNGGRIMWFPPYDINFNENTSVNWNSDTYIGRGEPVYSYINTERSGTLSFKMVVDHPSIINYYKQKDPGGVTIKAEDYLRFFAGCDVVDLEEREKEPDPTGTTIPVPVKEDPKPETFTFKVYFPNNFSGIDYTDARDVMRYLNEGLECNWSGGKGYEMIGGSYEGLTSSSVTTPCQGKFFHKVDEKYENQVLTGLTTNYKDTFSYGLNSTKSSGASFTFLEVLSFFQNRDGNLTPSDEELVIINKFKNITSIEINGCASNQGNSKFNEELSKNRAKVVKNWLLNYVNLFNSNLNKNDIKDKGIYNTTATKNKNTNSIEMKKDRFVWVQFKTSPLSETIIPADTKYVDGSVITTKTTKTTNTIASRKKVDMYGYSVKNGNSDLRNDESEFFEPLNLDDDFVEQMIGEYSNKIKHFHPAFHSTTPEGFNSRLTFLQQCTRQGPTDKSTKTSATNMSFGRPPVCVLRIGDFYNTKVIFNDLSITYEPLLWDLNTEGVGVQPMMASINMGFKFIGGSDLSGPISRLQNAVSFNYFANTGVYDDRNDRIKDREKGTYENLYQPGVYGED